MYRPKLSNDIAYPTGKTLQEMWLLVGRVLKAHGTPACAFWKSDLSKPQGAQHWKSQLWHQARETQKDLHGTVMRMERRGCAYAYFFKNRDKHELRFHLQNLSCWLNNPQPDQHNESEAGEEQGENNLFLHLDSPTILSQLWRISHLGLTYSSMSMRADLPPHTSFQMDWCLWLHSRLVPGSTPCMDKLCRSEPEALTTQNSQTAVEYFFGFLFTDQVVLSHIHITRKNNLVPDMDISCKPWELRYPPEQITSSI